MLVKEDSYLLCKADMQCFMISDIDFGTSKRSYSWRKHHTQLMWFRPLDPIVHLRIPFIANIHAYK